MRATLNYKIHRGQENLFQNSGARFTFAVKGRRWGATRGAMNFMTERLAAQDGPCLWVDTIYGNIGRYVDRYAMPMLNQLPKWFWKWNKQASLLKVGGTYCDFRSAERPENIEGFGYKYIFLNEAGIILDGESGEYLYKNSVLPMLMDFKESRLWAFGAPKGMNYFYILCEQARTGKMSNAELMRFTSYDNPFLDRSVIDLMADNMDEITRAQEIYGEFVEIKRNSFAYAFRSDRNVNSGFEPEADLPLLLSFDFNVDPVTCIVGQSTNDYVQVYDEITVDTPGVDLIEEICKVIRQRYPGFNYIVTGDASGRARTVQSRRTHYEAIQMYLGITDYQIVAPKFNLGLHDSRVLINSALANFPVTVDEGCITLINELRNAEWENGKLRKDRLNHKCDHLDAFRYLLHYALPVLRSILFD